jgi:hypothetical protein
MTHDEGAKVHIEALQQENEELRLAITGGEDAPGHIADQPLSVILKVAADNHATCNYYIDRYTTYKEFVEKISRVNHLDDYGYAPDSYTDAETVFYQLICEARNLLTI